MNVPSTHSAQNLQSPAQQLNGTRLYATMFISVLLWALAALTVQWLADFLFAEANIKLVMLFLLTIPLTGALFLSAKIILGLKYLNAMPFVAVLVYPAAFLDGLAMAWAPSFYGTQLPSMAHGAAWIQFGVGIALLLGFVLSNFNQPVNDKLNTKTIILCILSAIAFLIAGIVTIRLVEQYALNLGNPLIMGLFGLGVILAPVTYYACKATLGIKPAQALRSIGFQLGITSILDSLLITFYPSLYVTNIESGFLAIAWLLWTTGTTLAFAHYISFTASSDYSIPS